ncbi:poly(3-hydroxybutyrate) depolymerase [Legionella gratiana]|uniref:Poly(3-hydroxybutyrate) depolymerase n=1 Tax=Legionella gratiana TaxID=45066 RepID=A0A378JAU2_9GAMM|nr:poly(3-hydroxybutyrate) depolymerase [Legionella gratiana]STX43997.1 poly(3-hydroxybutyrate) depolymerase [Legionella gratiana]
MLHNPIESRSLYNWYDLTMRALQPYSDYCFTLSKRFKCIADTMNLPVNLPFLFDMQKELSEYNEQYSL